MRAYSAPSESIAPIRNLALNNLSVNASSRIRSSARWPTIAVRNAVSKAPPGQRAIFPMVTLYPAGPRRFELLQNFNIIGLRSFHSSDEDREPCQAICPKYWQLRTAGRPEHGVWQRAELPQLATRRLMTGPRQSFRHARKGNERQHAGVEIAPEFDGEAPGLKDSLDPWQRVTADVLQEHVVTAPQPHKRGNRRNESGSGSHLVHVFAYQADVVLDVLDDIHEEHQIGIRLIHRSSKEQRLSDAFLIAIFGIARVQARRRPSIRRLQDGTGKEPQTGTNVENEGGISLGQHAMKGCKLRTVIPVLGDIALNQPLFFNVHRPGAVSENCQPGSRSPAARQVRSRLASAPCQALSRRLSLEASG